MKNLITLLAISNCLLGCATPYSPKGFKGGYYDYPAGGKNRYVVGFSGNGYTDSSTVREYTHRRASEICSENGFNEYKLLNQAQNDTYYATPVQTNCSGTNSGNNFNANCTSSGGTLINKPNSELIIECEQPRQGMYSDTADSNDQSKAKAPEKVKRTITSKKKDIHQYPSDYQPPKGNNCIPTPEGNWSCK